MSVERAFKSGHHIFGKPDRSACIDIDADADAMKCRAEQVDTMPASEGLVSHAFLNGGYTAPGSRIRSRLTDILSAVAQTGKAFISDALVRRATIRAVVAETAVHHVPAMQECARGQGRVPGKGRQATGGTIAVDQLEELLGELLRLCAYRRWTIGSRQRPVAGWNPRRLITVSHAV